MSKNIIHLDKSTDLMYKTEFINTCDVMLHARFDGETFGLAIGEFSTRNKPIITSRIGNLEHVKILKDKGFYYHDSESLISIL